MNHAPEKFDDTNSSNLPNVAKKPEELKIFNAMSLCEALKMQSSFLEQYNAQDIAAMLQESITCPMSDSEYEKFLGACFEQRMPIEPGEAASLMTAEEMKTSDLQNVQTGLNSTSEYLQTWFINADMERVNMPFFNKEMYVVQLSSKLRSQLKNIFTGADTDQKIHPLTFLFLGRLLHLDQANFDEFFGLMLEEIRSEEEFFAEDMEPEGIHCLKMSDQEAMECFKSKLQLFINQFS